MAQEKSKPGFLSWLTGSNKSLKDVLKDVTISVDVDNNAEPSITLRPDRNRLSLSTLKKALTRDGLDIPDGHLLTSITFKGEERLEQLLEVLDEINSAPKAMQFPKLKERYKSEEMENFNKEGTGKRIDDSTFIYAMNHQDDPKLNASYTRAVVRLAVLDKQEALEAAKRPAQPKPRPAADGERKKVKPPVVEPAQEVVVEAAAAPEKSAVKAVYFSFPKGLSQERRQQTIADLQEAFGDDGDKFISEVLSKDGKKYSIKIVGLSREDFIDEGKDKSKTRHLIAKIVRNGLADKARAEVAGPQAAVVQEQAEFIPDPVALDTSKSVIFYFPDDLPKARKEGYIKELRNLYEGEGEKYVLEGRSKRQPERTGIKIIGVTASELMNPEDKTIGNKMLVNKLRDIVSGARGEITLADPEMTSRMELKEGRVVGSHADRAAREDTAGGVVKR